jgi:hypothetical protein
MVREKLMNQPLPFKIVIGMRDSGELKADAKIPRTKEIEFAHLHRFTSWHG